MLNKIKRIIFSIKGFFFGPLPPSREFVKWCLRPVKKSDKTLKASDFDKNGKTWERTLVEAVVRSFAGNITPNVDADTDQDIDITFEGLSWNNYIAIFYISKPATNINIQSAYIRRLQIAADALSVSITISDCYVQEIYIGTRQINADIQLTINHSHIGKLTISVEKQVGLLEVNGGSILAFDVPSCLDDSPFNGDVSFSKVYIPRKRKKYLLTSAQSYRNMRHHLSTLQNANMASLFHSAELAIEREKDKRSDKVLSYVYEKLSDYGASTLRPVVCFCILAVIFTLVIYNYDGAVPAVERQQLNIKVEPSVQGQLPISWLDDFLPTDRQNNIYRAITYTIQSTVNPLGIFSTKTVLMPKNMWIAIGTFIYSLLSLILITLFILAVRRRFKIQA